MSIPPDSVGSNRPTEIVPRLIHAAVPHSAQLYRNREGPVFKLLQHFLGRKRAF